MGVLWSLYSGDGGNRSHFTKKAIANRVKMHHIHAGKKNIDQKRQRQSLQMTDLMDKVARKKIAVHTQHRLETIMEARGTGEQETVNGRTLQGLFLKGHHG